MYYDILSFLLTQLVFSFTVAPFVLLTLPASFLVWARVYFYGAIGSGLATAFFASPGKAFLIKMNNERSGTSSVHKTSSQENLSSKEPMLGLPAEPVEDLGEMMAEIKAEMDRQKQKDGASRRVSSSRPTKLFSQ